MAFEGKEGLEAEESEPDSLGAAQMLLVEAAGCEDADCDDGGSMLSGGLSGAKVCH